jgi:hypothetical protein
MTLTVGGTTGSEKKGNQRLFEYDTAVPTRAAIAMIDAVMPGEGLRLCHMAYSKLRDTNRQAVISAANPKKRLSADTAMDQMSVEMKRLIDNGVPFAKAMADAKTYVANAPRAATTLPLVSRVRYDELAKEQTAKEEEVFGQVLTDEERELATAEAREIADSTL